MIIEHIRMYGVHKNEILAYHTPVSIINQFDGNFQFQKSNY